MYIHGRYFGAVFFFFFFFFFGGGGCLFFSNFSFFLNIFRITFIKRKKYFLEKKSALLTGRLSSRPLDMNQTFLGMAWDKTFQDVESFVATFQAAT